MKKKKKLKLNIHKELDLLSFELDNKFKDKLEAEFINKANSKKQLSIVNLISNVPKIFYLSFSFILIIGLLSYTLFPRNNVSANETLTKAYTENSQLTMLIAYNFLYAEERLDKKIEKNQGIEEIFDIRNLPLQSKSNSYADTIITFEIGQKSNSCDNIYTYEDEVAILHSYEYIGEDGLHFKLKTHKPNADLTNYVTSFKGDLTYYSHKETIAHQTYHPDSLSPNKIADVPTTEIEKIWPESEVKESNSIYEVVYKQTYECGEVLTILEISKDNYVINSISMYLGDTSQENLIQKAFIAYEKKTSTLNSINLEDVFKYELDVEIVQF